MLHAIASSGADAVLALGGVQALAAMVLGIEGLPAADVVVGAGNAYVAEAKRQLYGEVGIDLPAGPTEVVVIADETADPELVATDLLGAGGARADVPGRADHDVRAPRGGRPRGGRGAAARVADARRGRQGVGRHGSIAVVEDLDEAIALSDEIAPEHVEVQLAEAGLDRCLERLRNYGSLFLGEHATVAYGDKAIGTNHVLPTMGAARYTGGLWVGKFLKTCTYQRLTAEGTRHVAPAVAAIATAEGMAGHALTATARLDRLVPTTPPAA